MWLTSNTCLDRIHMERACISYSQCTFPNEEHIQLGFQIAFRQTRRRMWKHFETPFQKENQKKKQIDQDVSPGKTFLNVINARHQIHWQRMHGQENSCNSFKYSAGSIAQLIFIMKPVYPVLLAALTAMKITILAKPARVFKPKDWICTITRIANFFFFRRDWEINRFKNIFDLLKSDALVFQIQDKIYMFEFTFVFHCSSERY